MHKVVVPRSPEWLLGEDLVGHLRADGPDEATPTMLTYYAAAVDHVEQHTGLALGVQTWEMAFPEFGWKGLELEGGTVSSIVSVKYLDTAGAEQVVPMDGIELDSFSQPNRVLPIFGTQWPQTRSRVNAVRVRYQVGSNVIPPSIRAALLLIFGHLHENREENTDAQIFGLVMGAKHLLAPYRINLGI